LAKETGVFEEILILDKTFERMDVFSDEPVLGSYCGFVKPMG